MHSRDVRSTRKVVVFFSAVSFKVKSGYRGLTSQCTVC